jgi:hypothetical protein
MVLQQLPLQLPAPGLHQLFQLTVRYPPSRAAGKILNKMLEADPRPVKGSAAEGVPYGSIGLLFLMAGQPAPSQFSHSLQKSYTRRRCRRRPRSPGVPFGGLAEGIDLAAVPPLSRSAVLR